MTKKGIKKVMRYVMTEVALNKLKGRQNGFVFDIKSEIEWIDSLKGKKKFHSKHYAPLVHEDIPELKIGTIAYDDLWDMHDDRCINGYAPIVDGVQYPRITGPHYFYLNMYQIMMLKVGAKRKELYYPYYRVLDHMIFLELEKAEKDGYGIILGKARRMGLSYIGSVMTLWNMIFFKDNTVAVGAGKEDKAQALFEKMVKSMENVREEYRVSYRKRNDWLKLAYSVTEHKVKKDKGIGSSLDVRTFFSDPSAFEGGSYSFFIFEEIGIHEKLIKSYKASEPAFTEGGIQFGVPMLFGTGGEVDKGSRDFKIMFTHPESYNLKKLFLPKYLYYPGTPATTEMEDLSEMDKMDMDANFFDVRTGLTDEDKALKHILKRRVMARKSKEGYIKEVQSNPIKESDIFLKTDGGLLNRLALAAQRESIYNNENGHTYLRGRYDWQDPESLAFELSRCRNTKEKAIIRIRNEVKVKFVEDPDGKVLMLKGIEPINSDSMPYKPDIQGTDSYDHEQVVESDSLGCSMVYRCFSGLSKEYDMPIALISERGDGGSEDTFFDNNLKQSVYFRCENLIEYTNIAILNHYKDVFAHHYLRENPNLRREVVTNRGKQEYGVRMTSGATGFKSLVTTLLKMEVKDNVQNIHFDQVIDELIEYGDSNTDIAMAYGIVLIHKLDIFDYISDDIGNEVDDGDVLMDMAHYVINDRGELDIQTYNNSSDINKLETWDPRKHLEGEERENYLNFVSAQESKVAQEREKKERAYIEQKKDGDIFDSQRNEYIKRFKE